MREGLQYNGFLRLAQSIAQLLADSPPLAIKDITRELRRQGTFRGKANSVARALSDGAEFQGFVRLPDNRWTVSGNEMSD
jgi:hypothetical protein